MYNIIPLHQHNCYSLHNSKSLFCVKWAGLFHCMEWVGLVDLLCILLRLFNCIRWVGLVAMLRLSAIVVSCTLSYTIYNYGIMLQSTCIVNHYAAR